MGQHAAKMVGEVIRFAAGDTGSEGDMGVRDKLRRRAVLAIFDGWGSCDYTERGMSRSYSN
jgi:hypothetical protein